MKEAIGNLWEYPAQYLCVTTNGVVRENGELVMGAGVALEAKKRFPGLPAKLGAWVEQYGNRPFLCREEGIITFPTKHNWKDISLIWLIRESATKIVEIVDKHHIRDVVLTRPGCGNGGLSWIMVRKYIEDIFDDRFTVVSL